MAAHFDPIRQRYDVVLNKGRLVCASSRMDPTNTYASRHFRAKSRKEFYNAIKSTAREVDLSGELPAIAAAVSSISFVELVSVLKRCGISNCGVFVFFKKDLCFLVPTNRDSDSDHGSYNSDDSTGSAPDWDGGESGLGEAPKSDSTGSVTDGDGAESGVREAPKRARRKKMYVCWFVLSAVVVSLFWILMKPNECVEYEYTLCPVLDAGETIERIKGVYMENVVNFVSHFPHLVYKLLKMAPDFGIVILEFLNSLYDILNMIIDLLQSWEKLRSIKKD